MVVGGNSNIFANFHPENWGSEQNLTIIFFRWVETTNQILKFKGDGFQIFRNSIILQKVMVSKMSKNFLEREFLV